MSALPNKLPLDSLTARRTAARMSAFQRDHASDLCEALETELGRTELRIALARALKPAELEVAGQFRSLRLRAGLVEQEGEEQADYKVTFFANMLSGAGNDRLLNIFGEDADCLGELRSLSRAFKKMAR